LELSSVQSEYKTYKDSINDQVQKAKIDKTRIEAEQAAKEKHAGEAYQRDLDRLNDALNRVQKSGAVPGNETLRVAGSSSGSLPRKAEDTARTLKDFATTARTGCTTFYSEAMMDALQCSRLIQFVK
jgi:protein-arginine kinase activator protein McsA